MLRTFLDGHEIMQAEIVRDLGMDAGSLSKLANNPEANPTRETIDRILAYLSRRLNRPVTYEEAFDGRAALPAAVNES
jgi:transcriptional regulator with XRE-family HTH domain